MCGLVGVRPSSLDHLCWNQHAMSRAVQCCELGCGARGLDQDWPGLLIMISILSSQRRMRVREQGKFDPRTQERARRMPGVGQTAGGERESCLT